MKNEFDLYDVVQFVNDHKWCGCYGVIYEKKEVYCRGGEDHEFRYMVEIPIPKGNTVLPAYIYVLEHENALEYIGRTNYRSVDEETYYKYLHKNMVDK